MKSFKRFNEDASFARRSIGTGLLNFAGNVAKSLGTQPIEKGVRAFTSFASTIKGKGKTKKVETEAETFKKRRVAEKEYKDSINKGIQNVRDSDADKLAADAAKDPDLGKLDRSPPDGSTPKDTSPAFQETMRGLRRGKNLDPDTKLQIQRTATDQYKKWKKGNKPKK